MKFLDWLAVLLTVLFVALKLLHVVTWSWLVVLSPVLVLLAIVLSIPVGVAIFLATR